jgi:hypothetical protein
VTHEEPSRWAGMMVPVALSDGAVVLVPVERPPTIEDLEVLRPIAADLVQTLRARGLLSGPSGRKDQER